jgi:hypothetical protein
MNESEKGDTGTVDSARNRTNTVLFWTDKMYLASGSLYRILLSLFF